MSTSSCSISDTSSHDKAHPRKRHVQKQELQNESVPHGAPVHRPEKRTRRSNNRYRAASCDDLMQQLYIRVNGHSDIKVVASKVADTTEWTGLPLMLCAASDAVVACVQVVAKARAYLSATPMDIAVKPYVPQSTPPPTHNDQVVFHLSKRKAISSEAACVRMEMRDSDHVHSIPKVAGFVAARTREGKCCEMEAIGQYGILRALAVFSKARVFLMEDDTYRDFSVLVSMPADADVTAITCQEARFMTVIEEF